MSDHVALVPQALTAADFGRALGYRGTDPGALIRRQYRERLLPGPIDASLPVQSWRWSPLTVANYINPPLTVVGRPTLSAVTA